MEEASKTYVAIGQMSGTSGDGSDWVCAYFSRKSLDSWHFRIEKARTYPYTSEWKQRLEEAPQLEPIPYAALEREYEGLLLEQYAAFMREAPLPHATKTSSTQENSSNTQFAEKKPDVMGIHGHTVLHVPDAGITTALGSGHLLHAHTGVPVAAQFRKGDVALGGQGAPLVPIGDQLLFSEYDACINLGGVMNISLDHGGQRLAYDLGICNLALNRLAGKMGMPYDKDGQLGASFQANETLLRELNNLAYHHLAPPKSTGREWAEAQVYPLLDSYEPGPAIATVYAYIATQISSCVRQYGLQKVLITGGGAHNTFLMEELKKYGVPVELPHTELIDFKEALIFAFLGLLRYTGENNVLASATGATRDHCSGLLWGA